MERKNKLKRMLKRQILLNIAAIILIVLIVNLGIQLKPAGMHTTNTSLKFEWTGFASYALVDENPEFTSPIKVGKSEEVQLKPGNYWWCVPFMNKCLSKQKFAIDSEVAIAKEKISQENGNATYNIENRGNSPIIITIQRALKNMITGFATIDVGNSANLTINESSKFIAEQK